MQANIKFDVKYSDKSISFYKEDNQPGNTPTVTGGDSGGPATYYDSNNRAIVIGVAASTYSVSGYYLPSTYVNVRKFYPWIMSEKIKKESSIVGDNIVCSTKSYSVEGGYQATSWASSDSSGLSITSAGVATRNNYFNGEVIITANISTDCGTIPLTKTVSVGAPAVEITVGEQICTGDMAFFGANASGGSDWLWSSLGEKLMAYPYTHTQSAQYYLIGPFNTVVLSYTDACGGPRITISKYVANTCLSSDTDGSSLNSFSAYPNPASSELTVEMSKEASEPDKEATVILLDQFGTVYYKASTDDPTIKIPVADMERGTYFLHTNCQGKIQKKQILLE